MKNKCKKLLIVFLTVFAAICTLAGCKLGESFDDVIKDNKLVSQVTYLANGEQAIFTPNYSKERNLYYAENTKPLNIGTDGSLGIEYDGYEMLGWYYVALDEAEKPITTGSYTYNDEICYLYQLTDQKVDFSQPIPKDSHWIIAAKWTKISRVNVVLVHEDENASVAVDTKKLTQDSPLYDEATNSYKSMVKNGDVIQAYRYEDDGRLTSLPKNPITVVSNAHTFIEYYADEACTQKVAFPLMKTDVDQIVYAKYVTGNWTVVKTADGVKAMFNALVDGKRYYFLDGAEIDCTGVTVTASYFTGCEIKGNGAVIKNLTMDTRVERDEVAMFGKIEQTAIIENIAFENLAMTYRLTTRDASVYFAFTQLQDGASITNVTLQGSLTIVKPDSKTVDNLFDVDGNMVYTHCLFGEPYESDESYYAQASTGFKVVGNPADFITVTK